jgi:hypothetical protein
MKTIATLYGVAAQWPNWPAAGLSVTCKTPSMLLDGHAGGFVVHFQQCYNLFCFAGTRS